MLKCIMSRYHGSKGRSHGVAAKVNNEESTCVSFGATPGDLPTSYPMKIKIIKTMRSLTRR